ncbi:MAG: matrixin family metalloprotease [Myxococcales bacterium]|nr:matrixin family metalloprotease [Myxococcales bacterium]
MRCARLLAFACAVVPALAAAQPYEYLPFRMINTQAQPFEYYVDSRSSSPAGLSLSGMQQASEAAWDTWNALQCSSPKARSRGLTAGVVPDPENRYDLYSVAPVWLLNPSDPDFQDVLGPAPFYVLSVSVPIAVGGALKTCDVYLNGTVAWSLTNPTAAGAVDLQTVMTHEAGHCLGLGHNGTYVMNDVMVAAVQAEEVRRTLGPADSMSMCARYPLPGNYTAPCLADGGCNGPDLKCLVQPLTSGITTSICSKGCTVNTGGGCEIPTTCQASAAFSPGFSGACLLPGTVITQVGKPCAMDTECGAPNSDCLMPSQQVSGTIFWEDGYCSQDCAPGQPPCPAGSECIDFGAGVSRCLQNCRVGLSDCRPGYACAEVTSGTAACIPACKTNSDCADTTNYDCRVCDGLCVAKQNPSGQIGDLCTTDATCGPGQTCESFLGSQCSRQCSRGCATCPSGSTCTSTPRGLFCLRDCTGPGTCPSGLRCADTANGKSCLPACQNDSQCPVGQYCYLGECYSPIEDAGCTTLCNRPDAGKPIVPVVDAGTGGGSGTAGCGCQSVDATLYALLLIWLGFFVEAARRQAWRRR